MIIKELNFKKSNPNFTLIYPENNMEDYIEKSYNLTEREMQLVEEMGFFVITNNTHIDEVREIVGCWREGDRDLSVLEKWGLNKYFEMS